MKISERTLRIIASSALALSFVGVAYVVSGPTLFSSKKVNAASTEELLKVYASKDSDGDGLPDWQEALYGTDLQKADTDGDGISDGDAAKKGLLTPSTLTSQLSNTQATTTLTAEDLPGATAAPGSITEQFSQQFLQQYMDASNGQPMTDEQQQALVTQLMGNITKQVSKSLESSYTIVSIHTNNSVSTNSYLSSIESIIQNRDLPQEDSQPIALMVALVQHNDESSRTKIAALANAYRQMANDLLTLQVPPSFADQHLALIKSLDSLSRSTDVITHYEKDPLGTLGALSEFQIASKALGDSFNDFATTIIRSGEPKEDQPGYLIVLIARTGS